MELDFKTIFGKKPGKPRVKQERNPYRAWKTIVITFLTVNSLVIVASLYLFWTVNTGTLFDSSENESLGLPELDNEAISEAIVLFDGRAIDLVSLRAAGVEQTADPSL